MMKHNSIICAIYFKPVSLDIAQFGWQNWLKEDSFLTLAPRQRWQPGHPAQGAPGQGSGPRVQVRSLRHRPPAVHQGRHGHEWVADSDSQHDWNLGRHQPGEVEPSRQPWTAEESPAKPSWRGTPEVPNQDSRGESDARNCRPGVNFIKLFTVVNYKFFKKARVFVPGKLFKSSLMFVGRARSLPKRTTPEKMFHLGRLQPYSQTIDFDGKACLEQTLNLITKICNLQP